jgi:FMN phosphatase YigB (HAD superfamily)
MVNEDHTEDPRVVFFDIGQTLVSGTDLSSRRILAARLHLDEKQMKRAGRLIMTAHHDTPEDVASALIRLLPGKSPDRVRGVVFDLWQEQMTSVREIPGAAVLLQGLKDLGLRLGVISNIWHPFYTGILRACPEIMNLMDYRCLSYRVGSKKPRLDFFRHALATAGIPAASSWMVGDTYELDMEPAAQTGMSTLWVLTRPEREIPYLAEILRGNKPRPNWAVQSLNEIFEFFQRKCRC